MTARSRARHLCLAALLVLAPALAAEERIPEHNLVVGSLGTNANAVDVWALQCPGGTHHAHFDIHDQSAGGPTIGILAVDADTGGGYSAIRRAPQGGVSSSGQLNRGAGWYGLHVFKTGGSTGASTGWDSFQECHTSGHVFLQHLQHYIFQNQ